MTLFIYISFKKIWWGGWNVVLIGEDGEPIVNRDVSIKKREEIEDESEMAGFVKGICSPYCKLNFDVIVVGKQSGFLTVDNKERNINIDLRKYPNKEHENHSPTL